MTSKFIRLAFLIFTMFFLATAALCREVGHTQMNFAPSTTSFSNNTTMHIPRNNFHQENFNTNFHGPNNNNFNQQGFHEGHRHNNETVVFPYNTYPYYPAYYYSPPDNYYNNIESNDNYGNENYATTSNPNGTWVDTNNGKVPENAIVNSQGNGSDTYYCRAEYNNQVFYGTVYPNDGCYIEDTVNSVTLRFDVYQVLVQ